jgi:hypothetical protein
MNFRAEAIVKLRRWAQVEVLHTGRPALDVHGELMSACTAVLEEFRVEFEVPGVRYWEIYPGPQDALGTVFCTTVGRETPPPLWTAEAGGAVECSRDEYIARSGGFDREKRL